jgi:hypothetical protein
MGVPGGGPLKSMGRVDASVDVFGPTGGSVTACVAACGEGAIVCHPQASRKTRIKPAKSKMLDRFMLILLSAYKLYSVDQYFHSPIFTIKKYSLNKVTVTFG